MKAFPEMKEIYQNNTEEDGVPYYDDWAYHFYETEFEQFVLKQIKSKNEPQLRKIFNFVEDMLANGDEGIVNLVGVAVVESLYFDDGSGKHGNLLDTIFKYCGEKTRESFMDCINYVP